MFGIGTPEIIIIAIIALLIFGPSKLPELGKTIGKGLREFRNASSNLKDQINPLSDPEHSDESEANNLTKDKKNDIKKPAKRKTTKNIKALAASNEKLAAAKPKKSKTSVKSTVKKTVKPKN